MSWLQPLAYDPAVRDAARLAIAGLVGLAVGFERQWSGHASGPEARFAGVRTFLLLGLLGGVCGLLLGWGLTGPAIALLSGGAAFVIVAYFLAARRHGADLDGTTEAAALLVLALGALSGLGHLALASGTVALVVLALSGKKELHAFVQRVGEAELRAALQFAVLALVVLPLLPRGPYGPWGGVQPRALWSIVLVLAGINFAGYLARRAVGVSRGYTLLGLFGGVVSSTAVTLQFARTSRDAREDGAGLARGVIAACTVLLPRVAIVATALRPELWDALWPYLLPPFVAGVAMTAAALRAPAGARAAPAETTSPLRLASALRMALLFQVSIAAVAVASTVFGSGGVLATSVALGATDMDALTVSMSRLAAAPGFVALAAQGIAIGVLTNTAFKLLLAIAVGRGAFRRIAALGLTFLGVASGFGLWLR